jgi:hypothetical protein
MLYLIAALACAYLAIAVIAYRWAAPTNYTWRTDHLTAALLGLVWPITFLWLLMVCLIEVATYHETESD